MRRKCGTRNGDGRALPKALGWKMLMQVVVAALTSFPAGSGAPRVVGQPLQRDLEAPAMKPDGTTKSIVGFQ